MLEEWMVIMIDLWFYYFFVFAYLNYENDNDDDDIIDQETISEDIQHLFPLFPLF